MKGTRMNAKAGFSLVEIMIVILIMGLLLGVGIPTFIGQRRQAALNTTKANLAVLAGAVDSYQMEFNSYPKKLEDLLHPPQGTSFLSKKQLPKDAWGMPFVYKETPNKERPYELYSYGPNKVAAKPDERISAWD